MGKPISMSNLNYGEAIAALKEGKAVARAGWNGKGMCVWMNRGSIDARSLTNQETGKPIPAQDLGTVDGVSLRHFDAAGEGTVTRLPNLNMKAASGATVTGWLASQNDMLAEDWQVLD